MKIANADKLMHHFENVVDVKLFTPAQILTIIDTFSSEDDRISREDIIKWIDASVEEYGHYYSTDMLNMMAMIKDTITNFDDIRAKRPDLFGGDKP